MAAEGLHISLSAESIANIGGFTFTNSMVTSLVVSALIIGFAALVRSQLSDTSKPTGLQNFAEWLVEALYNFVHSITGDYKKSSLFFPFVATFFIFIILNNWFGLLPGVGTIQVPELHEETTTIHAAEAPSEGITTDLIAEEAAADHATTDTHEASDDHNEVLVDDHAVSFGDPDAALDATHDESGSVTGHVTDKAHDGPVYVPLFRAGTADLNTTIALGLMSIALTQFFGFQYLHLGYLKKYFTLESPIMTFVGFLELISEFSKIISFAFRLFGNIFAGEVLLVVIMYLAGMIVPMPFYGLEIFVGFMQALVFSMLSVVFFNMATLGHGEHE